MKRTLLFSATMLAVAGMSVNADNVYQKAAFPVQRLNVMPSASKANMKAVAFSAEQNVVAQKGAVSVVRAKDGSLKRVANVVSNKVNTSRFVKPVVVAAENSTLFEGFEGWDGTSEDWIPSGWVDESKVGTDPNGADGNWTWEASGASYYSAPFDGKVQMHISTALTLDMETFQITFPEQDEWLISPAVTPKAGDKLNFMLSYSPGWCLVNSDKAFQQPPVYEFTARNTNLEVLVSTDNGANWTELWNAIDDDALVNYTTAELDYTLSVCPWKCFVLNIDEYAGKSVKFAFRYVGKAGQDMALDNVTVGAVTPDASYAHMNLYFGPSVSTGGSYPNASLTGAYQPTTFANTSIVPAESEWEYETYENNEPVTLYSSDKNLVVEYPLCQAYYPTLTQTFEGKSASYQFGPWTTQGQSGKGFLQAGGAPEDFMEGSDFYGTMNCNYFNAEGFGVLPSNAPGEDTQLWQQFGKTDAAVTGFATYIPFNGAKYALSSVYFAVLEATGDTSLPVKIEVKKVDADGKVGDVIASGEAVPAESSYSYFVNGGETSLIEFTFSEKVGELVQTVVPTIDSDIFIELTIPEGLALSPLCQTSTVYPDYANLYTVFADGKLFSANNLAFQDGSAVYGGAFTFGITYTWFRTSDGDYRFDAPIEGGSKTFDIDAYYIPDAWTVEDSEGALYDWVNYTTNYDQSAGTLSLTFDVAELPSEVKDRYTYVTVSNPGSSARFTIAQGDGSSVEGVETSAVVVSVVDGNFVVKGSNASVVDVYNVAGQKVASAVVDGETVVNAQDLAKGMYILKFNDNTAIKVVK